MRVIAGKARRLQLKTIEGMNTRPTQDRTKETMFNVINNCVPGCYFLDLFSGSGGIGIEAASRGAKKCVLVENNRRAYDCIMYNLKYTKLEDVSKVMFTTVESAIKQLDNVGEHFDIVFMDPPYNKNLERQVLEYLKDSALANTDTLIVTEADLHTDFSYVEELGYELSRSKEYKTNKHIFLHKRK